MHNATPGARGFFLWLEKNLPRTYAGVKRELTAARTGTTLKGFGAMEINPVASATTQPMTSSLTKTIAELAQIAGQVYLTKEQMQAQNKVLNLQLQRQQAGLPPLDINLSQYGLPQPTVGISLDSSTKKLLMYGGGALALALLFGLIGGGRAARSR